MAGAIGVSRDTHIVTPLAAPRQRCVLAKEKKRFFRHLTPEEIRERDHEENLLQGELSRCWVGDVFDRERADHLVCGYALKIFDLHHAAYQKRATYKPAWMRDCMFRAIFRVTECTERARYPQDQVIFLIEIIIAALNEHVQQLPKHKGSPVSNRETLWNFYHSEFPEVKKLDVCWAAKQHYREWKRWIAGKFKDGSTPDLAFRRVLTSGKLPGELRKEPRPKGWQ